MRQLTEGLVFLLRKFGACRNVTDMRTLSTRRFTREFWKLRGEELAVTDRGRVVGTWTPASEKPQPIDYLKRVKSYCSAPLPFTGAELLRRGKKR